MSRPPVTSLNPNKLPLISATALTDFSACPRRFWFRYVRRLVPVESTEAQVRGTNWHKLMELAGTRCADDVGRAEQYLIRQYGNIPVDKSRDEWTVEYFRLLAGFQAYVWYWGFPDEEWVEQQETELPFDFQVLGFPVKGRIDLLRTYGDKSSLVEYKSTSRDISSGSEYWDQLRTSIQPLFYLWALHSMEKVQGIPSVFYDVWKCPTTTQLKLSQADTKKFVSSGGEYFSVTFDISEEKDSLVINGEKTLKINSKSKADAFAIRETPSMYYARVIHEMRTNPETYFQKHEMVVLRDDLIRFDTRLHSMLKIIRYMLLTNSWYEVYSACQSSFRCPYIGICRNCSKVNDVERGECPPGFKLTGKPRKGY